MFMNKKTFCLLPFTHISSTNDGNYRICCYSEETLIPKYDGTAYNMREDDIVSVWNSDFYAKLRQDLLNGIKNPACATCWKQEENGVYSKRQKTLDESHSMYPSYKKFIKDAVENCYLLSSLPLDLDVKIGTLCNLKCITCYPGASSLHKAEADQWSKEGEEPPGLIKFFNKRVKDLNIDLDQYDPASIDVKQLVDNLDPALKTAVQLSLVGGEPLVNKITEGILEYCVEKDYAKSMMLNIITNLSTVNDKMLRHLNSFKQPMLTISYDHVDPAKFKFIRYPADYNHFTKNIDKVIEFTHIEKKLSTTWSIFNIFDLPEIFDQWELLSHRIGTRFIINFGFVFYPNYFSIQYLEKDQKDAIVSMVDNYMNSHLDYKIFKENKELVEAIYSIKGFLTTPITDFDSVVRERTRVLELYDRTRNTNYKELFPFIKNYV